MWSGRIVPLFKPLREGSHIYKPLASERIMESRTYDPANSHFLNEPEEMLLPLLEDICFGTGIHDGSIVHVAYQWNPPIYCNQKGQPYSINNLSKSSILKEGTNSWLNHYGSDVAAWIVVSPFPIELLPDRIMQVIVRLGNEHGAFLNAVAGPATSCSAAMLQAEGLSTGDEGSLLLFPATIEGISANDQVSMKKYASEKMLSLAMKIDKAENKYLTEFSVRVPKSVKELWDDKNGKFKKRVDDLKKHKLGTVQEIGWIEELVKPGNGKAFKDANSQSLWTMKSKKITVRDRMIMIPWGEITRQYRDARWWIKEENSRQSKKVTNQSSILEDSYDILQPLPRYALLVRDPDLPIVIGVIPQRMLFQVIMRLRSSGVLSKYNSDIGVGSVEAVCRVLSKLGTNIWHIEQLPSQITFTERASQVKANKDGGQSEDNKSVLECSFIESDLRIVVACPPEWRYADEKSMHEYFKRLRHKLAQLKLPRLRIGEKLELGFPENNPSLNSELRKLVRRVNWKIMLREYSRDHKERDIDEYVEKEYINKKDILDKNEENHLLIFANKQPDIQITDKDITEEKFLLWHGDKPINVNKLIMRWPDIDEALWEIQNGSNKPRRPKARGDFEKCETWLRDTLNEFGEPLVRSKEDIEIHAPPLLRVFFSHSANPDLAEKDHIDQIKEVLKNYSESIVEGQFSAGLSTEELSRGRIRLCTALVSFFWPRGEYVNKEGVYVPPEWVAHEESFAMGLGLRVIRIRESSVRNPRYEYDRPTIEFDCNDSNSWERAKKKLEKELCEFVLREAQKFLQR